MAHCWTNYVGTLSKVLLVAGASTLGACRNQQDSANTAPTLAPTAGGQAAAPKMLFPIRTWTMKDCSVTPWTIAERLGYYKDEGVRLEFTGDTQPALQIPSILRGDNDVGAFHPNTIAVVKAGGAEVTAVGECDIEPTDPAVDAKYRHMWWFVNPEKHPNFTTFADLKKHPGKLKVATIATNICADFETKKLADKYGIPRDKIEWITMPDVQAIQSLKQGLIDVSEVHPPFYKGMVAAGARKIADSSEVGLGAAAGITYFIFRDKMIKEHPQEIAAFVRAMRRAQEWANTHPEQAAKYTEDAIGVPVAGNHYYSTSLAINENYAKVWLDDLETSGTIPVGKVTLATLVTHDIEKVNAAKGL